MSGGVFVRIEFVGHVQAERGLSAFLVGIL